MKPNRIRRFVLASLAFAVAIAAGGGGALLGTCGSFTDVAGDAFCPLVLEIFTLGITTGTSATTYDPTGGVNRLQMAAFLSRSVDGVLKRGSRRAAADQYWTTQNAGVLGVTTVGSVPWLCKFDGLDVWVANQIGGSITRVRASDGRLLETWTGLSGAVGVIAAMGRILAAGSNKLVMIDPSQAAGAVTTVATNVPANAAGLAFDGLKVWVAGGNSVSIATPSATIPWTVTTVTAGFGGSPVGVVYDGANIWVTNINANTLVKLDSTGAILQTVTVGSAPEFPVFDGTNIWVPNDDSPTVTVVRASNGAVLATLTGNGLGNNFAAAFDGQRVLVTSSGGVSLWKAADLTPLGSSPIPGAVPFGACSDGINFWITLQGANKLARF